MGCLSLKTVMDALAQHHCHQCASLRGSVASSRTMMAALCLVDPIMILVILRL